MILEMDLQDERVSLHTTLWQRLCRASNVRRCPRILARLSVLRRPVLTRLRRSHLERLFEVGNDILDMFRSD